MHLWHRIMVKRILYIGFVLLAMATSFQADAQCAMCKAVAESNVASGGSVASGLNYGILWLMIFPYLMMLTVGILWYRHNKKTKDTVKQ